MDMTTYQLSLRKARTFAGSLRRSGSTDRGWNGAVDRDLVRAADTARAMAQATPRLF